MKKPYVIMISIDGFRSDYAAKYGATNILRLASRGVSASSMISCYPSKTFPNHYTLVTGLYPAHHGIVDNSFFDKGRNQVYQIKDHAAVTDGSWYGGTPLWVLAEKQHMVSAAYFWVASEAKIQGVAPTYYFPYNDTTPIYRRIDQVIAWLKLPEKTRPHLIAFYLPEVDHAGHQYGPDDPHTGQAVRFADSVVGAIDKGVESLHLPVNYLLVSDHGMANVDNEHSISINKDSLEAAGIKIYGGETQVHLYVKDGTQADNLYHSLLIKRDDRFDIYLKSSVPTQYHYNTDQDTYKRIGDLLLMAHYPHVFSMGKRIPPKGAHGYDPDLADMKTIFYAWGPLFKKHLTIDPFVNVHIYPLVAKMLGLSITDKIDGNLSTLQKVLIKQ